MRAVNAVDSESPSQQRLDRSMRLEHRELSRVYPDILFEIQRKLSIVGCKFTVALDYG